MAEEIVERFHGHEAANSAHETFVARFQKGAMPDNISEFEFEAREDGLPIANLLKQAALVSSTSDAIRLIEQGGVKIDGEKISDRSLKLPKGTEHIYQVGKRRFAKVKIV